MPVTYYPNNNLNYVGTVEHFYFSSCPVPIPTGGIVSGVGLLTDSDVIRLQLYVTINGEVQVIPGQTDQGIDANQWTQFDTALSCVQPDQQVSGLGFVDFEGAIVLAPYCNGAYVVDTANMSRGPSAGGFYINTNTIVLPSNSIINGAGTMISGNQVQMQISTAPISQ